MSEFIAEASVLIQAQTTAFRAELAAALATVPKAIEIPIVAVGGKGLQSAAVASRSVAAAEVEAAAAANVATGSIEKETAARIKGGIAAQRQSASVAGASRAERHAAAQRNEITKGLQAQALSAVGLRGAIIGANSAFLAATAGAILFGKSIQSAAQFQTELAVFAATTGATAGEIENVSAAAKQLGADLTLPGVNAQDAAVAMTELAKAGLSVQESMAGARGILQLATAAGIDNAQATELAASAMNAFGLAGSDAAHVADVFANAANDAQGSITDIAIANQQASAAARQAGLSLEETAGILTVFARNGIKGSDAGTSLRTLLIRLINPTDKAAEVIQRLGLHLRDATGGINFGFFDEFARKTRTLTAAERDRDAAIIAGQDAFRGLSILAREGGVALDAQISRLNKSGTAAEIAAARTSGLAGAAENLKNQLASAGLSFGQSLAPALEDLANFTATAIGGVHDLSTELNNLAKQADKPIDIVVNIVRKVTGGEPGAADQPDQQDVQSRIRRLFSLRESGTQFVQDFFEIGVEANAALEEGLGIDTVKFPTLTQARKQIHDLIAELNKTPGPTTLNETVTALVKMRDEMAKGTLGTKEFAKSLGPFIARLQNLSSQDITLPPIKFPAGLEAGATSAIESAAKDGASKFGATFIPSAVDAFKSASSAGWQAFQEAGARAAQETAAKLGAALSSATAGIQQGIGQQAGLDDVMNQILLGGGTPQQQIANLKKQFAVQQGVIDKAATGLKGLTSADKGFATLTEAVRKARAKQVQINGQIDQIQGQVVADQQAAANKAEQRARDAQQARTKADQAVLDSFTQGQNRIALAQISANASTRLSDDLALQKLIISTAQREQKIIEDTVKDIKTRNAALADRAQTIKAAEAERDRIIAQIAENATEARRKAADLLTASLGKAITLAGLRENDKAQIAAIDKAIANARLRIRNYKKLGLNLQDEKIALEELINQKDEILKKAEEGSKGVGTTAFDLLKQFTDVFNQNAGNLIGGNQPFAGPTGFTADIAQFLVRRPGVQQTTATAAAAKTPIELNDDRLVRSMDRLADVIERSGNRSSGVGTAVTRTGHGLGRQFVDSNQVRQSIEARSGI